jgi:type I restriction-modification system DNA methylase subunit
LFSFATVRFPFSGRVTFIAPQPADTFPRDLRPEPKADYILANPSFNVSGWSGQLLENDVRWRFGKPPNGKANYASIQRLVHHIAVLSGKGGGMARFVMANGSLSSNTGGEGEIRKKIVEADPSIASSFPPGSSTRPASPFASGSLPASAART